jgi:ADP-heptose:LPS heptosyltransferase
VEAPSARGFRWNPILAATRALRGRGFDVALDLQGLWKSAAWARLSGAPRVVGFDRAFRREPGSALLLKERLRPSVGARHVIDKNLSLLTALDLDAVGLREFPLPALEVERERVDQGLAALGLRDFVLLNPGGGWTSKLWPPESFGALALRLGDEGHPCLVTFGPGEEGLADRVVAASEGRALRSFPTTLREYVALARRARLLVAADTGPLHLACAVGTPVVALFGPTDPERNGPFREEDRVVRRTPVCAPCYRRSCPVHPGVMAGITVDEVLEAVRTRLRAVGA